MSIEFRILSGTRTGQRDVLEKSVIAIGRHPLSDVRFDVTGDLDVSSRHAEVRVLNGRGTLRDLGSTNGTFVNGERLEGERQLISGDVISFGENGPRISVHVHAGDETTVLPPVARPAARAPAAAVHASADSSGGSGRAAPATVEPRRTTGERIAIAVREHTRELRRLLVGIAALLVTCAVGAYWLGQREARDRTRQLDAVLRRHDSLSVAFRADVERVTGRAAALDAALAAAVAESDSLRARLREEGGSAASADVGALSERLERAEVRRQALLAAAGMDLAAISRANGKAVVMIAVEMADGKSFTGTGFSVTTDGVVVTNKHLVLDASGGRARRTAVIFADTKRWLEAEILRTSERDDVALLRVATGGGFPAVAGVAPSAARVEVGSPVAIIGFPLGVTTAMEGEGTRIIARTTLAPGTVSKMLPSVLQVDAYAAEGSSGSPVLDRRGHVVGIVYGGVRESSGRIIYAVPSERLLALLPEGLVAVSR